MISSMKEIREQEEFDHIPWNHKMGALLQQLTRGKALLLILIVGFGGNFQVGYHLAAVNSPSPFIQAFINSSWYDRYKEPPHPQTATMIWSLIVSLYAIGGLCGSVSVKLISNLMGRKKGVICSSCISITAAGFMLMCKTAKSYEMIIVSRILSGYAGGLGANFQLMYLTEISPKKVRGRVTLTFTNFLSVGEVCAHFFGLSEILGREELWTFLLCVPACFSMAQLLVMPFLPESPRYLFIEKGDEEGCTKALQSLWGPGDYKRELDEMLKEQEAIEAAPPKSPLHLLVDKNVRWQLLTMCLIYWFNQLSGMASISTFSFKIFLETGIPEDKIRYLSLGQGVCGTIAIMSSNLWIERVGRRPMFWLGYGAMTVLWVLVTILLNLKSSNSWTSYVTASLIILIIVFFCGGPGAATGPLNSELFLQSDRVAALAIIGIHRWLATALAGFVFPFLISSLESYSFVLFACVCLLASLYTFVILPETKGKTLLEISEEFKGITAGRKLFREIEMDTKLRGNLQKSTERDVI